MKELSSSINKVPLKKIPRIYSKINKRKINCRYGRWTIEENLMFEENYILFKKGKISLSQLKKSVPTRTMYQTHSHFLKKKYELEKKYCAVANKKIQQEIFSLNEYFEKEKNEKPAKYTQLIYLRDEVRKKNYGISLENFIYLKKFFPSKSELKLDFQTVFNFLLRLKCEKEYQDMIKSYDKQSIRDSDTSYLEEKFVKENTNEINNLDSSLTTSKSSNAHSDSINKSSNISSPADSFFISEKEKDQSESNFSDKKFAHLKTADNTPFESKVSSNIIEENNFDNFPNTISDFNKNFQNTKSEAKNNKIFVINKKKCLNFNYHQNQENNNFSEYPNNSKIGTTIFNNSYTRNEFPYKIRDCNILDSNTHDAKESISSNTKNNHLLFLKQETEKFNISSILSKNDDLNEYDSSIYSISNSSLRNNEKNFSQANKNLVKNENFFYTNTKNNSNNIFKYPETNTFETKEEEKNAKDTKELFNNLICSLSDNNNYLIMKNSGIDDFSENYENQSSIYSQAYYENENDIKINNFHYPYNNYCSSSKYHPLISDYIFDNNDLFLNLSKE